MNEKQSDPQMLRNSIVDFAAYGGKTAIGFSSMKPMPKVLSQVGVDIAAELLKELMNRLEEQEKESNPVCRNSRDFQKMAENCGLERITHAWILFGSIPFPCYYMEGGDIAKFCKLVGIAQFPETMTSEVTIKTIDAVQKYGTVIYPSAK